MRPRGTAVTAGDVVGQFTADPDLHLPERPRLIPELNVIPFEHDGLLFVGTGATELVRGAAARVVMPTLMTLLDGTRSVSQLAAACAELPPGMVHRAVALLHSRGLLEDGVPRPGLPALQEVDAFCGRFIDATRVNQNRAHARDRLSHARVVVGGPPADVDLVLQQLAGLGIGALDPWPEGALPDRYVLAIVVATGERDDFASLFDQADACGVSALHVRVTRDVVQIGPLFIPGRSGCHVCMRRAHAVPPGDADPLTAALWLSLASLQAFHVLSRIGSPRLYNAFYQYERTPHGVVLEHRYAPAIPGCARCKLKGAPLDPTSAEFLTWVLHCSVALPPEPFRNPREHQNHYQATNIALTLSTEPPYYGAPSLALPSPDPLPHPPPWYARPVPNEDVSLRQLASLLRYAAGRAESDGRVWRIAPTGGGLGSPELFVLVREVADLSPGLYRYDSPRHALERLRDPSDAPVQAALGIASALPACVIVGTGALGKLRAKYRNFSYRLVNFDAGVALAYLHDVASAQGLAVCEYPDVHDKALADAIGLPPHGSRSIITFAIGLGGSERSGPVVALGPQLLDTILDLSSLPRRRAARVDRSSTSDVVETGAVSSDSFGATLLRRRSVRSYADVGVPERLLRCLAALMVSAGDARIGSGAANVRVRPWLALLRVSDHLQTGVYQIDVDRTVAFVWCRTADRAVLERCLVQQSLAAAPAMFLITGDVGAALDERGPRGYRELLVQAGALAGRTLVAATAYGLGACTSAGVMEDGCRDLTGVDGYRDCPLLAVVLGYPAVG